MKSLSGKMFEETVKIAFINLILVIICLTTIRQQASVDAFSSTISPLDFEPIFVQAKQAQNSSKQDNLIQVVSHKNSIQSRQFGDMINDIQIECNSHNIVVTLNTLHGFNGMIYPKGLSKNSSCMTEYHETSSNITYRLPLRSCNTMSSEVEDGIEYFNTVMVQPHRRLVTNQGRGYHIRCRYQTKERTITNQDQQLSVNLTQSTPAVVGSATMPSCSMKIYSANDLSREVSAENVRIGDELHLVISLEEQDVYGMLVTNCLVRDGMNWGEQPLLDDHGCPVDEEIMPQFNYAQNLSRASVTFQAHKFPYTSSVYYQCNVRLCFRDGGCNHVPPNCDNNKRFKSLVEPDENKLASGRRYKRWVDGGDLEAVASEADLVALESSKADPKSMSMEVFSGLNVNDDKDAASSEPEAQKQQAEGTETQNSRQSERDFCLSLRKFAIAISLASLILMAAIIMLIACLIQRRKRRKLEESRQNYMANVYNNSAPYQHSNRAYCRD